MTDEQIESSIASGELQLTIWAKLTHYGISVAFFLVLPMTILFNIKDNFDGTYTPFQVSHFWFLMGSTFLALLLYRIQRSKLKLKIIETPLTREQLDPIISKVANELEWFPYVVNEKVILAKSYPDFLSGSWGEQITILFDRNRILVNSICDPDKKSSVVSYGRNKENVDRLTEAIQHGNQ